MKTASTGAGGQPANAAAVSVDEVEKKTINDELWQACAGPLVNLPAAGTHVVYFPQGHSEQVAASMKKDVDAQTPNYPNLPSELLCRLHNVTLHADPETDEVYAQMMLQPVSSFDKEALLRSDLSMQRNKPQTEFFCKTLTASDTSTHGGFSVPRRAAEKIFPPLDFTMQRPAQEIAARDLHGNVWTFRHIYRGKPLRHLLTTGWSLFISGKRLFAGDKVLFIRDEKQQLLLGIRRANRQPANLSLSVLSGDSMHIGILAAAAHAAANNSPFTVFYNPRASPSEFVIPLAKYYKSVCSNRISLGLRFRMTFETDESETRRYMGTITGINDLDPIRWKNSQWRNLQVGWDESAGEKRNRVSIWEIEPVTAPFFIYPTTPFFCSKRPRQPGMPDDCFSDVDNIFRRTIPWFGNDFGLKEPQALPGLSLAQWMSMQQSPSLANSMQPGSVLQNLAGADISHQLGTLETQIPQKNNMQFDAQRMTQPVQQLDQLQNLQPSTLNPLGSIMQPQLQLMDVTQSRQNLVGQTLSTSQVDSGMLPSQNPVQAQSVLQIPRHLSKNLPEQQPPHILSHSQQQKLMQPKISDHVNQQFNAPENQKIQLQLLQKLQQQQQSTQAQQSAMQQPSQLIQLQDHQKQQLFDISPNFSKSLSTSQMLDTSHTTSSMIPQTRVYGHQMTRDSSQTNHYFAQPPHEPKLQQLQPGMLSDLLGHVGNTLNPINHQPSAGSSSLLTGAGGGGQSAITDDAPSCSTSPSTDNCLNGVQLIATSKKQRTAMVGNDIAQSSVTHLHSSGFETIPSSSNLVEDLCQKVDVEHSFNASKSQQGFFASQTFISPTGTQIDYLDSSSSATSVLSQNDLQIPPNNSMSFSSQSILFRDASHDGEGHGNLRSNVPFGGNVDDQFRMPMMPDSLITMGMVGSDKDLAQPELSSSMVSPSFGVPDMTFNSVDSTVNDGSFMNGGAWAPPPQIPRMRTFTKVYKRGAVGRSIDIARYSGYDELKQDLARRFGIEGQLEDSQRVGWKLVYVDHENDVLLVGDDPWEEFVRCVRCIKILSPQEVQQMSMDGDFGNGVPSNQDCSSSGNGLA